RRSPIFFRGIGLPVTTLGARSERRDFRCSLATCGGGVLPCTRVSSEGSDSLSRPSGLAAKGATFDARSPPAAAWYFTVPELLPRDRTPCHDPRGSQRKARLSMLARHLRRRGTSMYPSFFRGIGLPVTTLGARSERRDFRCSL